MTETNPYANNIALDGFYNLRDGGDLPTPNGHVKAGRLMRSDQPKVIDAKAAKYLEDLPLKLVVDLRTDEEVKASPDAFVEAGFTVKHLPILGGSLKSIMADIPSVSNLYSGMAKDAGPQFAEAVGAVADASATGAVLVHCTAGKDRTGVVIALCQELLGVPRDEIVDNYKATHDNLAGVWFQDMTKNMAQMMGTSVADLPAAAQKQGIDFAKIQQLATGSPASAIESALNLIDDSFGGVSAYLQSNGLTPEKIELLRSSLLETK